MGHAVITGRLQDVLRSGERKHHVASVLRRWLFMCSAGRRPVEASLKILHAPPTPDPTPPPQHDHRDVL